MRYFQHFVGTFVNKFPDKQRVPDQSQSTMAISIIIYIET